MCDLDHPQQMLYSWAEPWEMHSRSSDTLGAPASLHGCQVFRCELVVLPQVPPEVSPVTRAMQEVQIRLSNCNVVQGGVGVQLLMPLHEPGLLVSISNRFFVASNSRKEKDHRKVDRPLRCDG